MPPVIEAVLIENHRINKKLPWIVYEDVHLHFFLTNLLPILGELFFVVMKFESLNVPLVSRIDVDPVALQEIVSINSTEAFNMID